LTSEVMEAGGGQKHPSDLTSAKLEKLKRLNTALKEQWGSMEAVWYEHDPTVSNEDAEVLMEMDEIVTATEKAVGSVLETSEQFIKERLAKPFPEFLPTIRVWRLVQISDAGAPPAGTYQTQRKAEREVEKKDSVKADEKAEIKAEEEVWKEDVRQFNEDAGENAEQDVCGGDVRRIDIGEEVLTRRELPGSELDLKRGVGEDVRRDGEDIPTRQELPGSELDLKRGVGEDVRRNGEEIPGSDTHYLQKGQQSLPGTTSVVVLEDNREVLTNVAIRVTAATVAPIEGGCGGHGQCDNRS
jgi:hypothetical protein